jgi:hypothetical protein
MNSPSRYSIEIRLGGGYENPLRGELINLDGLTIDFDNGDPFGCECCHGSRMAGQQ